MVGTTLGVAAAEIAVGGATGVVTGVETDAVAFTAEVGVGFPATGVAF